MLITSDQIRAGRALINWSQADLAERTGLARPTIVNIETGTQKPELKTLAKIIEAFDSADIEFGANEAVQRKAQDVKIYHGKEDFICFFEELHENIKNTGGEVFVSNVNEKQWTSIQGVNFEALYVKNMTAIKNKIDFRILIEDGDEYMPAEPYATYRWVHKDDFAMVPFHVYSNRLSVFLFLDEPIILSLINKEAADLYKEKFLMQWESALPVPTQKRLSQKNRKTKK